MMAPIDWLTVSAAATQLGCPVENVQEMVDAGYLHARWIHDHLSISAESVDAYLDRGEPHPTPVPRDPDNPAEDEMTDDDNENYELEKRT